MGCCGKAEQIKVLRRTTSDAALLRNKPLLQSKVISQSKNVVPYAYSKSSSLKVSPVNDREKYRVS